MKSFIEWIDQQIEGHEMVYQDAQKMGDKEVEIKCIYSKQTLLKVKEYLQYHHADLFKDEMQLAMDKVKAKYGLALDNLKDR